MYNQKVFFLNFTLYFWLRWVFIAARRLSLVAVCQLLIAVASLVVDHRLISPEVCAIFQDQG